MDLQSRFNAQLNELDSKDAKQTYKELYNHVNGFKKLVQKYINDYERTNEYGNLYRLLGKNDNRKTIQEALIILQEELDKVNV